MVFVHNVIMMGPSGEAKTLLARAMPGILPEMFIRTRRSWPPHHAISYAQGSLALPAKNHTKDTRMPRPKQGHSNNVNR